jgi:hypothetical protein
VLSGASDIRGISHTEGDSSVSRKKKRGPVVITRKDKRLFKSGHLAAFILTGGTSAVYSPATRPPGTPPP